MACSAAPAKPRPSLHVLPLLPMAVLAAELPPASSPSGEPEGISANQPSVADVGKDISSTWTFSKLWPIAFVLSLACFYHMVFIGRHCLPLLLKPAGGLTNPHFNAGLAQVIVYLAAQNLFLYSYFRCMLTPPGGIPDSPEWKLSEDESGVPLVELKRCGERRYCRWCMRFKPDRTHHCRTCRSCVLKMDHHCSWTNNCIGFHNHKAFLLCIFYTLIGVDLVAVARLFSHSYEDLFPGAAGLSIAVSFFFGFFAALFTFFCCFHVYLVGFAYTTLEFRERYRKTQTGYSPYDFGFYRNICAVLGENPLLWLIPVFNSPGEGVNWFQEEGECEGGCDGQRDDDPVLLNDGSAVPLKKESVAEAPLKTTSTSGSPTTTPAAAQATRTATTAATAPRLDQPPLAALLAETERVVELHRSKRLNCRCPEEGFCIC